MNYNKYRMLRNYFNSRVMQLHKFCDQINVKHDDFYIKDS